MKYSRNDCLETEWYKFVIVKYDTIMITLTNRKNCLEKIIFQIFLILLRLILLRLMILDTYVKNQKNNEYVL